MDSNGSIGGQANVGQSSFQKLVRHLARRTAQGGGGSFRDGKPIGKVALL